MPVTDASYLSCWRCGAGLARLSLPITRRDMCPECASEIHACRMCVHYDPGVARQCREDDAEDVTDKTGANFCEWFEPSPDAWQSGGTSRSADQAAAELFGEDSGASGSDDDDPWARIQAMVSDDDQN